MILGTITVGAAVYMKWSQGIEEEFHVDEEKKQLTVFRGFMMELSPGLMDGEFWQMALKCLRKMSV